VTTYKLTLADGPEPASNGTVLGDPVDGVLDWEDLPAGVQATLAGCGFTEEHPETWCLVTPAGEDTGLAYPPHATVEKGEGR
jgi:hypothetical protein